MYKVLISCAGTGSRVEKYSNGFNKSLISIDKKTVISHIIDNIDNNVEIVICLGYKSETLKQYLDVAYYDRSIEYVYIDDYENSKSGLGYSISKAKHLLDCPFIFISNDTILKTPLMEPDHNYVYYSKKYDKKNIIDNYRTIKLEPFEICEKKTYNKNAYVGVCGIYDYRIFWKYIEESIQTNNQTIGESYSINRMQDFAAYECDWYDTGNEEQLLLTKEVFNDNSDIHVLEKSDECIWFTDDKVIKYHKDRTFIKNRVERTNNLCDYVPKVLKFSENFFSYEKFEGSVVSNMKDCSIVNSLIRYLDDFWVNKDVDKKLFEKECYEFYKTKTYERVNKFLDKYPEIDNNTNIINGLNCLEVKSVLDSLDWKWLANGTPVRYHGDLHFENILYNNLDFKLIDWRQNFGSLLDVGDIYYDLAKLFHGLIVSHKMVNDEKYSVTNNFIQIEEEFYKKESIKIFENYIKQKNYDLKKVYVLTGLIYLNVAVLHHQPYDKFLFMLGKYMLNGRIL